MKVTCAYCDCYVEADENGNCPRCGAALGETIRAEEARIAEEQEKAAAEEAEAAAEEAKKARTTTMVTSIAGALGSVLGGLSARHASRNAYYGRGSRHDGPPMPMSPPRPPAGHHHDGRPSHGPSGGRHDSPHFTGRGGPSHGGPAGRRH